MKKKIVILTGPTAVGKSELGIRLAKDVGGEIISADSMQVYRGMDIGTAKIKGSEMNGVKHYLIDILDPDEEFNVSSFVDHANDALDKIYADCAIPIVVGGTAFYIQALLKQVDFSDDSGKDEALRSRLEEKSTDELYGKLLEADPESCEIIHKNNKKRIIRALEYYYMTGEKISEHNAAQKQKEPDFDFAYFVLTDERSRLYDRIDARVDKMMDAGLEDEVKGLMAAGFDAGLTSMQAIGYKEMRACIEGEISRETAVGLIKQNTRHFAKRQLTWFRKEPDVIWIDYSETGTESRVLLDIIKRNLKDRGII